MAMLTAVARQIRTGGMDYSSRGVRGDTRTSRAKKSLKREANRSERQASLGLEEYGSEADDALMEALAEQYSDNEHCSFCHKSGPAHHFFWMKRFEVGACDCCEHFIWVPLCTSCCLPPGLNHLR